METILKVIMVIGICVLVILWISMMFLDFTNKRLVIEVHDELKEIASKHKQEIEDYKITALRLNNVLVQLCSLLGIGLSYHPTLDDAAGRFSYYLNDSGRILMDDLCIKIIESQKDSPYVLAHELGHCIAIKQRNDKTEEGADMEALRLCKTILTPVEQKTLETALAIYFN